MDSVYIASYGAKPIGKYREYTETDLALDVICDALKKVNLLPSVIEGVFTTPNFNNFMGLQGSLVCEALRIEPKVMLMANCGGMAGGSAIRCAYNEIKLGNIDCAVVYAAEREYSLIPRLEELAHKKKEGCPIYDPIFQAYGNYTVVWDYACSARRYMHDFGATEEDFAMAMVRDSENAKNNPRSAFNKRQLSMDEVMNSDTLSSPIKQLDTCTIRDGAAAIILMSEKKARECSEKPVLIRGFGEHHDNSNFIPTDQFKPLHTFPAIKFASKRVLENAKVTLNNIDVAELYAPFTPQELMIPEDIGWFKKGKMIKGINNGETEINGKIPINTLGGVLGRGHPAFVTPIYETIDLITQINGEAGENQVKDANIGLMQCEGGMLNNALMMILEGGVGKQ
jgi:acetyl-CoA C-acetyltransferase